ncbi:ABC transporter substrate-binding protein [Algihabitans albus]|uniref:ABC transporter substrate-binding protein n=1 Tax=Algihabitans albus TaxID=2164067 RepID=UPI000E5C6E87|nr:ABC transporter substrate-binding protein [Algihabitans albus]
MCALARSLTLLLPSAVVLTGLLTVPIASPATAQEEPPFLAERVELGQLPPLTERLPSEPRRDLPQRESWQSGSYGGSLTLLTRGGRDARDLVVLGYARLLVWNETFELVPDILQDVEVEENRSFTLKLRPGHRWSDGQPFTAEDFRFWWEQVANNPELSPGGPPSELLVEGRPPRFEVLDAATVRFTWDRPNNQFLPTLAATRPPFIYRPAHYLRQFHPDFADLAALEAQAEEAGLQGWAALFDQRDRPFLLANPDYPTLQPWRLLNGPPTRRWRFARNPYFHRVDAAGNQLPYIDEVVLEVASAELIPAKVAAGDSDLQDRGLTFRDAAFLKEAEERAAISLRLWPIARGAQLAIYPNLNTAEPGLRRLIRTTDFRLALSLAIDRGEINQVIYQGLALPGANSVLPDSLLYRPALRGAWAQHDPQAANVLLDGLALDRRDSKGYRLNRDGERLTVIVEAGDTDPAEIDVLELIRSHWREIGVELLIRSRGRSALRNSIQAGETAFSVFYGFANGLARPSMSPKELAPTGDRQNHWPLWGLHYESNGSKGEAPDLPAAQRLLELFETWKTASDLEAQRAVWEEMLMIHAAETFTIGLIARVPQPVTHRPDLRNVPESAPYLYDPGAYLGYTRPDTYWIAD